MNKKLFGYLKKYWLSVILSPLLMVIEVAVDLILPTLMSDIVDEGVVTGNIDRIWAIGIKMIVFLIFGGFGGIVSTYFASHASQNFGNDLRRDAFGKTMNFSLEQTDKFTTGSLVTRLTNDITQVQNFVEMALRMFVRAPLSFIGGIIMALRLNANFAVVLGCALPLQLILVVVIILKMNPMFKKVQEKLDRVNSVVQENIGGARVVKAYVREDYECNRFDGANTELRDTNLYVGKLLALLTPLMTIIMNVSVCAVIYIGGYQVEAGNLEVGKIMASITYITQILSSLFMVSMMFQMIARSNASASRIREVLETVPAVAEGGDGEITDGGIEFKNVSFHYPNTVGLPVLSGVNLKINPGEYLAILGTTGSGKTSLVNLIPRLYDVTGGEVLIDGKNVKDINTEKLRDGIGFVLQKSEIFSGTVEDNIRFGNEEASFEEVVKAAKVAQADEFITEFKDGYQTGIDERGASLSGGQKQRVAIARAMLKKPKILIFDDSTSALDVGTEVKLRDAMKRELVGTTIVMIAQRISSVMHADRIAVLENGGISACGTHDELMKTSESYREIYYSQIRDDRNEL